MDVVLCCPSPLPDYEGGQDPSPHNIDNRSVERETGIETRGAEEGQHMKGVTAPQD